MESLITEREPFCFTHSLLHSAPLLLHSAKYTDITHIQYTHYSNLLSLPPMYPSVCYLCPYIIHLVLLLPVRSLIRPLTPPSDLSSTHSPIKNHTSTIICIVSLIHTAFFAQYRHNEHPYPRWLCLFTLNNATALLYHCVISFSKPAFLSQKKCGPESGLTFCSGIIMYSPCHVPDELAHCSVGKRFRLFFFFL